jgi:serine/threonine-protein kinase
VTTTPIAPSPPAAAPLFAPGQVLDGNYRIVESFAAGGIGEIYVAVHLRLPRKLAIKTLHPEFAGRQEWVARFCREACILAQLRHPNIVQVLDFNVAANGVPYIAMELIEGTDLRGELDRGRRFEIVEIMSIVRQVASALDAAHAAGVVHRDLKPDNVVLAPAAGQLPIIKVIDFGVSLCGWSGRVTGDSTVFGTPDFMAPEQAQGLRDEIDGRTDQFALAALAYTLLSGRTPFSRDTPVAVLYAVVYEEPAALGAGTGWDAAPVERALRKGMARDRDQRYPSVLAFVDALEAALVEGGALPRPATAEPLPAAPAPEGARRRPAARGRMHVKLRRGIPMLLASLVVAGAVLGGLGRARVGAGWHHLAGLWAEHGTNPIEGGPR